MVSARFVNPSIRAMNYERMNAMLLNKNLLFSCAIIIKVSYKFIHPNFKSLGADILESSNLYIYSGFYIHIMRTSYIALEMFISIAHIVEII